MGLNLPNIITIGRIIAVPLIVWLIITGRFMPAFTVFVIAGVSDAIDGFLAKRFGLATELGAYLDPIADKLLLVSIYVALGTQTILPAWLVILVVSRDVLIVGAVMLSWLLDRPVKMTPLMISKANTAAQIILAAITLGALGFGIDAADLISLCTILVAGLTILSTFAYMRLWVHHMANGEGHAT
jgi:cardiolipin synthase